MIAVGTIGITHCWWKRRCCGWARPFVGCFDGLEEGLFVGSLDPDGATVGFVLGYDGDGAFV